MHQLPWLLRHSIATWFQGLSLWRYHRYSTIFGSNFRPAYTCLPPDWLQTRHQVNERKQQMAEWRHEEIWNKMYFRWVRLGYISRHLSAIIVCPQKIKQKTMVGLGCGAHKLFMHDKKNKNWRTNTDGTRRGWSSHIGVHIMTCNFCKLYHDRVYGEIQIEAAVMWPCEIKLSLKYDLNKKPLFYICKCHDLCKH